jgi:outer membrane protein assembly factor BamB
MLLAMLPIGSAACSSNSTKGGGVSSAQSVLERNKNPSRDGHFLQPTLTKTVAATMTATPGFTGNFTGTMYASPLYIENGPGGKGVFIAATTGNDVYALDETTGAIVWMRNVGSSPQQSGAGCGSINPIGIESTPVIDGASRTIYVGAAIGTASITRHEVHALSVDDGSEKSGWPVDVSTVPASGGTTFTPQPQNQRSALSLVGGTVYVAYGGHVGDCGPYHGWVIGINAANPAMKGGWATGGQGEGIWAAAGMASDGNGVFASTGNRTGGGGSTHQDSEEVVRITGLGTRADT